MFSRISLISLLFLTLCQPAIAASKSDRAKEKRWEEQIVPGLLVGEPVKLNADGTEFLALYAESSAEKIRGAMIILHGMGVHPAWTDITDPVRMAMPEHGWHTLSLQMPILGNEVTEEKTYAPLFDEVPARIQAGVDFLKARGIKTIVLDGHSLGNAMTLYYLNNKSEPVIKAIISVAAGPGYEGDPRTDIATNFSKIKIPFLDVYGSADEPRIHNSVKKRTQIAHKLGKKNYTVIEVQGANHFFHGKQDELVRIMNNWLEKTLKDKESNK